jgi:cell division septum initiation protein DivIVA
MTKKQELDALHEFASSMGTGSYVGEWLLHIFPLVRMDLESDHIPMQTIRDTITKAEEQAKWIVAAAETEAERILRRAKVELAAADAARMDAQKEREYAQRDRDMVLSAIAAAEREILRERQ